MKKYINLALAVLFGMAILSACIEETLPTDYVLSSQIEASESSLDAMVAAIYTTMVGYENDDGGVELCSYSSLLGMMEHCTTPIAISGAGGYNTCSAWAYGNTSATTSNRGIYPTYIYYGYIKCVNDIIGMIDPDDMSDTEKHYLGIAYAYRALYYMDFVLIMEYRTPTDSRYTYTAPENDLTNLGVPIVTEQTASEDASNNPRATVDEVYDLILSDLAKAEEYLEDFTRSDLIEPNLAVVYGLYARAYQRIASHTDVSEVYTDAASYWELALSYAEKAISTSGCTPLTEDQWTDPTTGFNDRTSQNSWLLATTISESNTYAAEGGEWGSFNHAMLFGTETNFSVYGWRVGRSLDRAMYERLSDEDWRKNSWLAPNFFYESTNQVDGEDYLVETDDDGNFINNKWATGGDCNSTTQSDWSDEYSGWGTNKTQYQLTSSASWIRAQINYSYGYQCWPYNYVNIKFRPHNGDYTTQAVGGATDFPILRVEELYFIKAEAEAHSSVSTAVSTLESLIQTRNTDYTCDETTFSGFMEEMLFQKAIEFWGEGVNYFDAKRLSLGRHSGYEGVNDSRYQYCYDIEGVVPGLTPGWPDAERNANAAIYHYNNPYTAYTLLYYFSSNDALYAGYGQEIDLENHTFFDVDHIVQ